jgi:phosphate-selective porin OprO/OprP
MIYRIKGPIRSAALGVVLASSAANAAADVNAIEARLRSLEAEIAKLKRDAKEAKALAAAAQTKATNVANAAKTPAVDPQAPPPVFVDVRKGLFVETEDMNFAFKVGGRLLIDGGGIAGSPGNGWQGNVGFTQARLEVEGRMKPWFYKLQYDFANTTVQLWNTNLSTAATGLVPVQGYVTDRNFLWGGFRDAYLGVQDQRLSASWLAEPVYFKIGSQWEPFSLEAITSSKFRDLIERPLAVDAFAPARHIGIDFGMIGKDNWTLNAGLFSLSFQDLNTRPVNTSSGNPGIYAPTYNGFGSTNAKWFQPWGGGAYWEATGRATWAPILDEHRLVHVGVSGSYHQPNSSTAYSDDRNSAPGNRLVQKPIFWERPSWEPPIFPAANFCKALTPIRSCSLRIAPRATASTISKSSISRPRSPTTTSSLRASGSCRTTTATALLLRPPRKLSSTRRPGSAHLLPRRCISLPPIRATSPPGVMFRVSGGSPAKRKPSPMISRTKVA